MKNANPHTALLLFAQSTKVEAVGKKFIRNSYLKNLKLARFLNHQILAVAQQSQLPYYIIDEHKQQGDTFGERLSSAFQSIFDLGYEHVIAIGNDCPALSTADLLFATSSLENGQSVLGPDKRNGAYLIGLSLNHFDKYSFASLAWQSQETFSSLKKYTGNCQVLSSKNDFNQATDFSKILKDTFSTSAYLILLQIAGWFNVGFNSVINQTNQYFSPSTTFLRGPPLPLL